MLAKHPNAVIVSRRRGRGAVLGQGIVQTPQLHGVKQFSLRAVIGAEIQADFTAQLKEPGAGQAIAGT